MSTLPVVPDLAPASRFVPERSCVACRRKRPQSELVRLVRSEAGWVIVGASVAGKRPAGRGGYICADMPSCWAEKKLKRAYGAQAAALSLQLQAHSMLNS